MTDIPAHPDPAQGKIMRLYIAFGVSLLLMLVPHIWAAVVSLIFLLYVMIACGILRSGKDKDDLAHNHATFVLRTIWIGGLFAIFTMTAGSIYMLEHINNAPLEPCIQKFLNFGPAEIESLDVVKMSAVFEDCMHNFVQINWNTLIYSMAISAGPILLYFVMRYARGFSRAIGGYRVAHPKAWL
jgi:uncharacterized membrane protein